MNNTATEAGMRELSAREVGMVSGGWRYPIIGYLLYDIGKEYAFNPTFRDEVNNGFRRSLDIYGEIRLAQPSAYRSHRYWSQ